MSQHLGDRVKHWMTHNEPWCISFLSHQIGEHAPGWNDWNAAIRAAHHVLLSHGWAVPVIRSNSPDAEVGIVLNFEHVEPASSSAADHEAARLQDGYFNRWFLDAVYGRQYPADMVDAYAKAGHLPNGLDFVEDGDFAAMAVQTDFLGVNYYTRSVVRMGDGGWPQAVTVPDVERTEMGWEIYPQGLYTCSTGCTSSTASPSCTSRRTGAASATARTRPGRVRTSAGSTICASTSPPCTVPCRTACRWRAISSGR